MSLVNLRSVADNIHHNLQLVVLDCPYSNWQDPFVRNLFGEMVGLKLRGYQKEYPWGILPLDGTDFIATHLLVCERRGDILTPLLAYKSLTLGRSNLHRASFPVLNLAAGCGSVRHVAAVQEILGRFEKDPWRLSYDGSWTIDPSVRKDVERTKVLREIMQAVHVLHHEGFGTLEFLSLGAVRFKVEQFLGFWGYRPIEDREGALGALGVPSYFDERVMMMHLKGSFSPESRILAEKYIHFWESRIEVASVNSPENETREAA